MIVKMKKISVVVEDKDIHQALNGLSEAGVLHLEHQSAPQGAALDVLIEEHERMMTVISALRQVAPLPLQERGAHVKQMFINVFTSLEEIKELEEDVYEYQVQINLWGPWGSFDPQELRALEHQGIYVKLYAMPQEKTVDLPADVAVETVFVEEGIARVIVFSQKEISQEFDEIALPEFGLDQLAVLKEEAQQKIKELEMFVQGAARYLDEFEARLARVELRIAYQQALTGRGVTEGLSVLKGYCPVEKCDAFERKAKAQQWAYVIQEPEDGDIVPTLLRNPKWVGMIDPVMKMINVLPGYGENDISAVFLIFFSVFFGILIGDAGYGLVFALATGFAHWKFGKKMTHKEPIYLMYLLSGMTVIWGALTGTFFGQMLFSGIKPLVPWLNDAGNVQRLCFFIGALHLSIAHVWRAVLKWPSVAVLSEFGWLCLLWGMFFLARVLVLGEALPPGAVNLFMIGPILVAFFTKPNKNPLKALASGLGALAMNAVNTFTDVVSYIRLFAVGLATVAVADAFNVMVMGLGFDHILTGFLTAIILVLGHLFNMVLGAMAILVHGLRLNVLEFSSHMNLEWAGVKYRPFGKVNGER